ncbi:hypothetical protein LLT6_15185 [Lactococcus cremoris subsp. cremoris TIFN6]|uniref:Uncharacterized protein n=1 Tax=Lactococcus cremoris subsp. cremoris TIFN6 TaxID=1234876 RepID=T0S3U4_LACLC|nr:hypothetical protein LLT6_15185 [Lactococcus cremoris subsp. cremoris TIFN6]
MKNGNWKNMKWLVLVLVALLISLGIFKSCQISDKNRSMKNEKIQFAF